jgi:hypothetical protein
MREDVGLKPARHALDIFLRPPEAAFSQKLDSHRFKGVRLCELNSALFGFALQRRVCAVVQFRRLRILGWSRTFANKKMAGVTGLEPAASGVTGRRSNRLSYTPIPGLARGNRIAMPLHNAARRATQALVSRANIAWAKPVEARHAPISENLRTSS